MLFKKKTNPEDYKPCVTNDARETKLTVQGRMRCVGAAEAVDRAWRASLPCALRNFTLFYEPYYSPPCFLTTLGG